ncbi:MAG: EscF/YscF/HrpA family type III secretion system needle major subunit [Pseudomonadota bacterium]
MAYLNTENFTGVYGNISDVFNTFVQKIAAYGVDIASEIGKLDDESIDQADLIEIEFAMGQYNAMLETASTVVKSITDMMSTLAQRSA